MLTESQPLVLTIVFPYLPPLECSPNWHKHHLPWAIRKATAAAHDDMIGRVREQVAIGEPLARAMVTVTFTVPDRRRRDKGNLIGAAKPWLDGLTLAGVIKDDAWQFIEEVYPPVVYEKGVRKTVIEVNENAL